mgnify:CR=1 FL=1
MSTLQQVPRITGGEIYLTAAGRRIAAVGSCEIQARREGVPLIPFGALEGAAAELGPMQYTIALTRLSPEDGEIDLFSLNSFSLVVKKNKPNSHLRRLRVALYYRDALSPATMRWKEQPCSRCHGEQAERMCQIVEEILYRSCKRSCRQAVKRCSGSYPAP